MNMHGNVDYSHAKDALDIAIGEGDDDAQTRLISIAVAQAYASLSIARELRELNIMLQAKR